MSKKGGGFFDDFFKKPFGGLADFNHDGRESFSEQWLALQIAQECTKESNRKSAGADWGRHHASVDPGIFIASTLGNQPEDDENFGVNPDDGTAELYEETPEDYDADADDEDAFAQTEAGCFKTAGGTAPNAAAGFTIPISIQISWGNDSDELREKRRQFIAENKGSILAASYLTESGDFLLSQAAKDHFQLPVTLPDETEKSEYSPSDIFRKLDRVDTQLACDVCAWLVEQFLPYCEYASYFKKPLTCDLVDTVCTSSEESQREFRLYLREHPDFAHAVIQKSEELPLYLGKLIVGLIEDGLTQTAETVFSDSLRCASRVWREINCLFECILRYAKNYNELETMEFIEATLLPALKSSEDAMIREEIPAWEKEIAEYKEAVEQSSEKYAYSRRNAWRHTVPDGEKYDIDPRWYSTKEAYMEAYRDAKYAWRKLYVGRNNHGLDPNHYESQEEFRSAIHVRLDEEMRERRKEAAQQRETLAAQQRQEKNLREEELAKDRAIYTYCGVKLSFSERPYSYRTEDDTIRIGDRVIVPVGKENAEAEGLVVSVGQYARLGVPFPVEHAKFILRKLENTEKA